MFRDLEVEDRFIKDKKIPVRDGKDSEKILLKWHHIPFTKKDIVFIKMPGSKWWQFNYYYLIFTHKK